MKFDCYVLVHRRFSAVNAGAAAAKMRKQMIPVRPIPVCEQCGSNRITDQGFDGLHCDKCGHDQPHRESDVTVRKAVDPPIEFVATAKEPGADLPVAVIQRGKLICASCKKRSLPVLGEYGFTVTHHIDHEALEEGEWRADGGSSSDRSDEGTHMVLECSLCYQPHQLPAGAELELEWM